MRTLDSKKRELIIEVARNLFQKKGLRKTSMSDIAKESGLAVGTLYLYFENKDALVHACVEVFLAKHHQAIKMAINSPKKASVRLLHYLRNRFREAKSTRSDSHAAELTRYIMKLYPHRRKEEGEMIVETVSGLIKEGIAQGEFIAIRDVPEATFVFCHSIAWFFPIAGDAFREEPRLPDLERVINWFLKRWQGTE